MSPLITTFAADGLRPYGFGQGSIGPVAMELISSQFISTNTASVTFSSIPSTYTHLQIRFTGRASQSGSTVSLNMTLNGDNAANYSWHVLQGNSTTLSSSNTTSTNSMFVGQIPLATATSGSFGFGVIDLLDYTNVNKYKTIRALNGEIDGSPNVQQASGNWRSTAAVTSLTLAAGVGQQVSGSRFSLYGIRGQ